jgi:hypothetical protein
MTAGPIAPPSSGGGPVIAVSADATAVVAWAALEPDHTTRVFVRRASAAGPSPVLDDATVASLGGAAGASADSPAVGVAYDSSHAWVAFRETVGGVSRVIVDQLLGDELRRPVFADSLPAAPGPLSAATPALAVNGNNQGLLACDLAPGNALSVAALGTVALPYSWTAGTVVAPANAVAPASVAALSADGKGVVAFTPSAGALDVELARSGAPAGATAIANPALGPILPASGLAAAADDYGDMAVAFVAGAPGSLAVAVEPIVAKLGAPRALGTQLRTSDRRPVLRWQPATDHWSRPAYAVYVDGVPVARTTRTSYTIPAALANGRHTWRVVATDALGRHASSQTGLLLIDAARPARGASS